LTGQEEPFELISAKAIAIEICSNVILVVYVATSEPGETYFETSEIVQSGGYAILMTRSQMSGTGHFFDEAYWIWSEKSDAPIELKLNSVGSGALSNFLPSNHRVRKGGHFDIRSLSFQSYTWREGDGNCCPTGGKYSVTYGIENDSLVIRRAVFDYSDLEERALWQAQRSADSMYLKNPPIIYEAE
jgi:hypothetical protein